MEALESKGDHETDPFAEQDEGGMVVPPEDAEKLQEYVRAVDAGGAVGPLPVRPLSIVIPDEPVLSGDEEEEKAEEEEKPRLLAASEIGRAMAEGLGLDPACINRISVTIDAGELLALVDVTVVPLTTTTEQWREWVAGLPLAVVVRELKSGYETKPLPSLEGSACHEVWGKPLPDLREPAAEVGPKFKPDLVLHAGKGEIEIVGDKWEAVPDCHQPVPFSSGRPWWYWPVVFLGWLGDMLDALVAALPTIVREVLTWGGVIAFLLGLILLPLGSIEAGVSFGVALVFGFARLVFGLLRREWVESG